MSERNYSIVDHIIMQVQACLDTVHNNAKSQRPYPANHLLEAKLSSEEQRKSIGFMRVNDTGEVCAQALYRGQALMAKSEEVRNTLLKCGEEETDHLSWCQIRLNELNGKRSYLNVAWYGSSFAIGMVAGFFGDGFNLGFVEETEKQVGRHLQQHLDNLSIEDKKSRAVIHQMQSDEASHANNALNAGAKALPMPVKYLMKFQSKVMTNVAYWI